MNTLLAITGAALVVPVVYPFVAGPFVIRASHMTSAGDHFDPIEPAAMPTDVVNRAKIISEKLEAHGFRVVEHLYQSGQVTGTTGYVTLLRNEAAGDLASIGHLQAQCGTTVIRADVVVFCTEFEDGIKIGTSNVKSPGMWRSNPKHKAFKFPMIQDPVKLYFAHKTLTARFGSNAAPTLPREGRDVFCFNNAILEEYAKQVEYGYYYLDEDLNAFRPTWKGAVLMSWKNTQPVFSLRTAVAERSARRLARQLNV